MSNVIFVVVGLIVIGISTGILREANIRLNPYPDWHRRLVYASIVPMAITLGFTFGDNDRLFISCVAVIPVSVVIGLVVIIAWPDRSQ